MTAHYRYNAPHQRYVDAQINARVMKLVDMTDSKSVARNSVPVQVRPLVPSHVLTHSIPVNFRLYSYCLLGLCVLLRPMRSIVIPKHMVLHSVLHRFNYD